MPKETMDGVPKLDIDEYLSPLTINGMSGRLMHLPPPKGKKKEILLIYGIHASLERMVGFAKVFNRYGAVTVPDLPGFGGMDSFYKIGKKPTLDNYADYLAAFIKMRYKNRRITVSATSFGFAITTRMFQKYPKLAKQVDLYVSAVGFTHRDDFKFSRRRKAAYLVATKVMSWWFPALLAKAALRKPVIRRMQKHNHIKAHSEKETEERRRYRIEFEVWLWQNNDIRTYFYALHEVFTMNLCTKQVDLPVHHIAVDADQYLDNHLIEQHMRVIYSDFIRMPLQNAKVHAPTILATAKEAGVFVPPMLRRLLNK